MSLYDKRKEKKTSREMLKLSIAEVMAEEDAKLEEEFSRMESHIFSDRFEQKMEVVLRIEKRKTMRFEAIRYIAATLVTLTLTLGIILIGNEEAYASKPGIAILEWLEEFFVVSEKFDSDKEVLFEESQIGYLPDGFEKVAEETVFSKVYLKYQNQSNEVIVLEVYRDKIIGGIDYGVNPQEVGLNTAGYEYRYIYEEKLGNDIIIWLDSNNACYILNSSLNDKEEAIKIMNSISY